ncbi:hypothetical protein N8J89_12725 [Crossiella sp. CA-258035]|uniref:hypothetical protein n=1 Tax=Crossiella sp. CA-258035 TaxID=2981138 RepID=UPI0024BC11D9|nr:hypothetical protein [Crossiella sp. CA-258035]WHT21884.1 hypothetical protein N8J89_12725 [Crossiella sp. CA-258035]
MTMPSEHQVLAKWGEIGKLAEKLVARSSTPDGFSIRPSSALAGDDRHSSPFQVSHAVKTSITSAVDHLHALCALVLRAQVLHIAAPATLARGALECAATAVWIASPASRDERLTRTLQWQVKNIKDGDQAATSAGIAVPTPLEDRLDKVKNVAAVRRLQYVPTIKKGYTSTEAVKAAEMYLPWQLGVLLPWRLASGFAHGRSWAMLSYGNVVQTSPTADPTVQNLVVENDLGRALFLGLAAAHTVKGAVEVYEQRGSAP